MLITRTSLLIDTHSFLAPLEAAGLLALEPSASGPPWGSSCTVDLLVEGVAAAAAALGAAAAGAGALEDEGAAAGAGLALEAVFRTSETCEPMGLAASVAVLEAVAVSSESFMSGCFRPSGSLMEFSDDLVDMTASATTTSGWAISIGPAVVEVTSVLEGSELSSPPIMLARMGGLLSPAASPGAGGGVAGRGGEAGLEDRGRSGGMSGGGPGAYGVDSSREERLTAEAAGGRMGETDSGRVVIGTEEEALEWSFFMEPAEPWPRRMPGADVFMDAMLRILVDRDMGAGDLAGDLAGGGCLFSGILERLLLDGNFLGRTGLVTSLRGVLGVLFLLVMLALLLLVARGEGGAVVRLGTGGLVVARLLVPGVAAGLGATLFLRFRALTLGSVHDGERYSLAGDTPSPAPTVGILDGDSSSALSTALGLLPRPSFLAGPGLFLGVCASCALATLRGDRVGVLEAGARLGDDMGDILGARSATSGSLRTGDEIREMGTGMREGADREGLLGSSSATSVGCWSRPGADGDLVIAGSVCTPRDGDGVRVRGLSMISMKRDGV